MRLRASHTVHLCLSVSVSLSLCRSPPSVTLPPPKVFLLWPTGGSATAGGIVIRVNTTILLGCAARLRSKAGLESSLNNWTADCSRSQKRKKKKKNHKEQHEVNNTGKQKQGLPILVVLAFLSHRSPVHMIEHNDDNTRYMCAHRNKHINSQSVYSIAH